MLATVSACVGSLPIAIACLRMISRMSATICPRHVAHAHRGVYHHVAADLARGTGELLFHVLRHRADRLRVGLGVALVAIGVDVEAGFLVLAELLDVGLALAIRERPSKIGEAAKDTNACRSRA